MTRAALVCLLLLTAAALIVKRMRQAVGMWASPPYELPLTPELDAPFTGWEPLVR